MNWNLEKRKIKDLHENSKNPRTLSKQQSLHLQESISKFGQCEPIVINTDNLIIGGHQRYKTLKKLRHKEISVYVPNKSLSDKEVKELSIRLNKNIGDWDYDLLANAWNLEDLVNWGFELSELHLEEIPPSEKDGEDQKPIQKCKMTIYFMNVDHLQEAETQIAPIVEAYSGATYKVKIN